MWLIQKVWVAFQRLQLQGDPSLIKRSEFDVGHIAARTYLSGQLRPTRLPLRVARLVQRGLSGNATLDEWGNLLLLSMSRWHSQILKRANPLDGHLVDQFLANS